MKRTVYILVLGMLCLGANAQKKALDHSVYDGWQSATNPVLSEDGTIVSWRVTPQEGDAQLHFFNVTTGRGEKVARGGAPSLTRDGRWAFFKISAPFADTRQARIKKKKPDEMPKDSLGYMDLKTFELKKLPDVSSFRVPFAGRNVVVYESGSGDKKKVVVFEPETGAADTLRNVDKYTLSHDGSKLALVYKKNKKDSLSRDAVVLRNLASKDSTLLSEGKKYYSAPKFDASCEKLVFLASADSNATGNKHCSVFLYEGGRAEEIVAQGYSNGLPKGWTITENSAPYFSANASRLFLGIAECVPENDTTLVDFETAKLDIWNYDIYLTPPMQKAQASRLRSATAKAVINLGSDRGLVVPLSTSVFEQVTPLAGGDGTWALAVSDEPYQIDGTWDSNDFCDVSLVNLENGRRTPLFTRLEGTPRPSPEGKYLVWYDYGDSNYYSYRVSDGKIVNLTEGVDGLFYNDEDDHPSPKPYIDRPHWIEGDSAFLLADKFDIFRFSPDGGKPVNVTKGEGRKNGIQYRVSAIAVNGRLNPALTEAGVQKPIARSETVWMTAFERSTKRNGFASVPASGSGIKKSFLEEKVFPVAAQAGKTILYQKGDFRNPYDFYVTVNEWKSAVRLSELNPQQAEYRWGDVQLVHWNAYDGTPLDGLLFTPEDYDPNGKYPMMIYFYEKNAETLFNYRAPAPSRSTINIPLFVSNGYVVFVPDIVYKDGHPGESAYNCICAGAEAMCAQFPFIDKSKMAIQGQSWGGYQTAYLVTRTNMFAAAGAGAPVGNMTSAYGGIRWDSGMVRAMQYEHGQSRIGASLWDEGGLDLYIENSPVFHTENVTTPVLIMHNDNDGAVPWYQGIEFFMALRRFHHPAWLLEYNDEAHNLAERRNAKDLSVRLSQFFDHYLKGAPMPAWMKTGVPVARKGQYFGFEYAE